MTVMSKPHCPKKIKAILFDLGKVLVHFNFDPAFKKFSKVSGLPVKDIEDYFVNSGLEVLYDGGKISSRVFYSQVCRALDMNISFERFRSVWSAIFTPKKDMIGLLRRLSKNYRLVLVSNTNQIHFEYIRKKYAFMALFSRTVISYKEKMRKPDEAIYLKSALACKASPEEIYYIDDRHDLTEAAKAIGFNVFTYRNNFKELLFDMKSKGIR